MTTPMLTMSDRISTVQDTGLSELYAALAKGSRGEAGGRVAGDALGVIDGLHAAAHLPGDPGGIPGTGGRDPRRGRLHGAGWPMEGPNMSTTELATVTNGAMVEYLPPAAPGLVPNSFTEANAMAEMMAKSELVPAHLRGKPANCFLVIEQAVRWRLSPFAVAQATSVISGKLMFEGKLVAAVINTQANLEERLQFISSGEGEGLKMTVIGRFKGEKTVREVTITLRESRTRNEMWSKQPEQQLCYHGARVWARRHCPELMMGIYSPEEMAPAQEAAPAAGKAPTTVAGPVPAVAAPTQSAVSASAPDNDADGNVTDEDINVRVPVYQWNERHETWDYLRDEAKVSPGQNAKIHVLIGKLGHHLDRVITDPVTKKKSTQKEGKYRQKLMQFNKSSTAELSSREASSIIGWLEAAEEKVYARLNRDQDQLPAPITIPAASPDVGPLMDLTSQLIANGHKTTDAQLGWVNHHLADIGHPRVLTPSALTAPQIDALLARAQGEVR